MAYDNGPNLMGRRYNAVLTPEFVAYLRTVDRRTRAVLLTAAADWVNKHAVGETEWALSYHLGALARERWYNTTKPNLPG